MKVVILAAGENPRGLFPWPFDKPKCLYSYRGQIQLERVVERVRDLVPESKIRIVVGYKASRVRDFVRSRGWAVEIVENERYRASALASLQTGLRGLDEDVMLLMADELVTPSNLRRVAEAQAGLVLLASAGYPYYNFAVFKFARHVIDAALDERYASSGFLLDVRAFLEASEADLPEGERRNAAFFHDDVDPGLDISTGYALGWMMLDMVRSVGRLERVERVLSGPLVVTLPIVTEDDYTKDLDSFALTDEYRRSLMSRLYMRIWPRALHAWRSTWLRLGRRRRRKA